ncbi:MAG: cytochrome c oxidase accessory protein CcoG, partial [Gammaproteobacteria bacterium]|nr:cytochrome c oxidase accessory protein CcoG [Gammaproteobacteria bacterium]
GLVRYTTENRLAGKTGSILRPRIAIYGLLLTGLSLGGVFALSQRVPARLDVIRDRNTLYRELPDGSVENVYTLKLLNMDRRSHRYAIRVEGVPGLLLVTDHPKPEVDSGEVLPVPVKLRLQADQLTGSNLNIRFVIQAEDDEDLMAESESRFIAPLSVVAPQ